MLIFLCDAVRTSIGGPLPQAAGLFTGRPLVQCSPTNDHLRLSRFITSHGSQSSIPADEGSSSGDESDDDERCQAANGFIEQEVLVPKPGIDSPITSKPVRARVTV